MGSRGGGRGRSYPGGCSLGGNRNFQQQSQGWAHATAGIAGATHNPSTRNGTRQPPDFGAQLPRLYTEQWRKLLNLLNSNSIQYEKLSGMRNFWILDSGCSHHMTGGVDSLYKLHYICPYTFGLSNGAKTIALQERYARLSPELILRNVLLILDLR